MKKRKILVITTKNEIDYVINNISLNSHFLYVVDSICVLNQERINVCVKNYMIKSNRDNLVSYVCHNWIDEILIATNLENVPFEIYNDLQVMGVTINIISEDQKNTNNKTKILYGYNVVQERSVKKNFFGCIIKRIIDIIGAIVGCFITLLLIIIIGPIIYFESPGPIIFKQKRVGLNGRIFTIYKFRSMNLDAESLKESLKELNTYDSDLMFKIKNDPRLIPKIGKFIRKTMIDEFPQFFNVLCGDMSLVGTRPPTIDEWNKYEPKHRIRMSITPGITGFWQVYSSSNNRSFNKVVEYDKEYIEKWSLCLDVKIILKTIIKIFKH